MYRRTSSARNVLQQYGAFLRDQDQQSKQTATVDRDPHLAGPDRIVVQVTYQPSSDPSSVELLRGRWRTDIRLADLPRERFFTRSRASRLRELQAEVDRVTKP